MRYIKRFSSSYYTETSRMAGIHTKLAQSLRSVIIIGYARDKIEI